MFAQIFHYIVLLLAAYFIVTALISFWIYDVKEGDYEYHKATSLNIIMKCALAFTIHTVWG